MCLRPQAVNITFDHLVVKKLSDPEAEKYLVSCPGEEKLSGLDSSLLCQKTNHYHTIIFTDCKERESARA
jgi:hypothetical protein